MKTGLTMKMLCKKMHLQIIPIFLLLLLLTACVQQSGRVTPEPVPVNIQEESVPSPLPAAQLSQTAITPLGLVDPPPADETHFDFAASEIPAREFFMSLVEGSPVNMVIHPDVTGTISIDLKNTTIAEILQVVHNVYGYPYFRTGTVYQVMPATMQARTFNLNYLTIVRRGVSQTIISSGQVTRKGNSENDGNNSNDDQNDSENQNDYINAGSLINTKSTTNFWDELQTAIEILIGTEDGRKVVVQPQASVVVVVAMPDELVMVENYLRNIEENLHRQVVIEAKVIDVTLSDGYQTGINWAGLHTTTSGKKYLFGQTGGGTVFDDGLSGSSGNGGNLGPGGSLPDALETLAFGGVFSMAMDFGDFKGFIELLGTQGEVQVLSSPRISTVNNQKAMIKVGSDEFFVTDISSDTTNSTTSNTTNDITLTPFFSGIALDVTPQIDQDGFITMHIHPTISKVEDQQKEINVFGQRQSIPLAYSTVRESDSVVHARSGQLIVIGGLMQEITTQEEAGIPILMDIPVLGWLFRHTRLSTRKSELVILLRPQVIGNSRDWKTNLDATRERFQNLSPKRKEVRF